MGPELPPLRSLIGRGLTGYFFNLIFLLALAIFVACVREDESFQEYVLLIGVLSFLLISTVGAATKNGLMQQLMMEQAQADAAEVYTYNVIRDG